MPAAGGRGLATAPAHPPDADDTTWAMDPARVLADPDSCAALEALANRLRSIGYDGNPAAAPAESAARHLVALGRGEAIRRDDALDALGTGAVSALERTGALRVDEDEVCLTARIFPMRSVLTVLPPNPVDLDTVYLGPDSIILFRHIWAAKGFGDRAVDLATGNGFIAAALATRYDHVIAADLSPRCASTAALVPVLNPHVRTRFAAIQLDVAAGLRPGSFDLVTANAPWVPETVGPDGGPPRRFAAGGPTGCELPQRFLDEAAGLLAPGGRAFIACLDVTFDDGRRPIVEHLPTIRARGLDVTTTPTRLNEQFDHHEWVGRRARGAVAAQHVVVEIRRRP